MDIGRIKRACTETLVIGLLRDRPMHGYEMGKEIARRSEGFFELKHGTLYPVLHRLEREGYLEGSWQDRPGGKPRKHYCLTPKGLTYGAENTATWREFIAVITRMMPEVGT